jgi:hypothetical protein
MLDTWILYRDASRDGWGDSGYFREELDFAGWLGARKASADRA